MLNNINAQIINNDNAIAARKLSSNKERRAVILETPQYVPEYSITKRMEEQDTFRQNVLYSNYKQTQSQKRKKTFLTTLALAATAIIGIIFCKKS